MAGDSLSVSNQSRRKYVCLCTIIFSHVRYITVSAHTATDSACSVKTDLLLVRLVNPRQLNAEAAFVHIACIYFYYIYTVLNWFINRLNLIHSLHRCEALVKQYSEQTTRVWYITQCGNVQLGSADCTRTALVSHGMAGSGHRMNAPTMYLLLTRYFRYITPCLHLAYPRSIK